MIYRPYITEDFAALYAIEEICFEPPFRFGRPYMRSLVESEYSATWIAEDEGKMAGFAIVVWTKGIGGPVAYIQTIEVAPEQRRRGVAGELLRRVEDSARSAGAVRIWLHVDEKNIRAVRLYEASDYHYEGREPDYYAPSRAGEIYSKHLGSAANELGTYKT
jgi:ribosomal-protein-alanine N-acetyltransferase